jgi:polyhydroxybutyrate depolymerase
MAYRMACERAEAIAAVVVIAGAAGMDPAACQPAQPVSVVHMHGTADPEFNYEGNGPFQMAPGSPGAIESATRWAGYDGCDATRTAIEPALDLDSVVDGAETHRESFGCPAPIDVELWTMEGTSHLPGMTTTFVPTLWPWLLDHRRTPSK